MLLLCFVLFCFAFVLFWSVFVSDAATAGAAGRRRVLGPPEACDVPSRALARGRSIFFFDCARLWSVARPSHGLQLPSLASYKLGSS